MFIRLKINELDYGDVALYTTAVSGEQLFDRKDDGFYSNPSLLYYNVNAPGRNHPLAKDG